MPVYYRFQTTKYIRQEITSPIPIIALTAHFLIVDHNRGMDAGMDNYMSKPFKQRELLEAIKSVLQKNGSS